MYGQGIVPTGYDAIVDALDEAKLASALGQIRGLVRQAVAGMPQHDAYVAQHCRMATPAAAAQKMGSSR